MANRDYPNDYFAWYNDDKRLAVVELDTTSTSGEKTKEKYDSYQSGADITNGLRITYHSKYEAVTSSSLTSELSTTNGVDIGLQENIVCYVKARMHEDMGDLQKAQYYRAMYEKELKQYPSRKSGVRTLSVPRM
tara:strand:- start:618 stop:1019 length:402 start_codon:yes stop_codon:yes gene_type:complete